MPNIREQQRRLSQWATDHPEARYRDLWNLISDPAWLAEAYQRIRGNAGANTPGVDRDTRDAWECNLPDRLAQLHQELRTGTYTPQPCRRVYIPKRNGKLRPLGIPALKDRIVQEAVRMAVEPIFEADFSEYSYGFRPHRSTQDAAVMIRRWMMAGKKMYYVIEGDIHAYFDTIHHRKLMALLKRRIADKQVLALIWQWLKAGVMEQGKFSATDEGTPQGGVISPLLANIYLHELDRYLHERFLDASHREKDQRRRLGGFNIGYVRYADDFVVFCNGSIDDVRRLKAEIAAFLTETLQLTLSDEKTTITQTLDGFDFLGFQFYLGHDRTGGLKPKMRIPRTRLVAIKEKIKALTADDRVFLDEAAIVKHLNAVLRGWGNYYRHLPASTAFSQIERYTFWRVVRWYRRKYQWSTAQVLTHRQTRDAGNQRLFAEWQNANGSRHQIRLVHLGRDIRYQPYCGRRVPNPFLGETTGQ